MKTVMYEVNLHVTPSVRKKGDSFPQEEGEGL